MTWDAGTIGALGVVLSGALAGVAAIMNAGVKRREKTDADLRDENTRLHDLVKAKNAYINVLYAYAVRLYRKLLNLGEAPEPVPEEDKQ